MSDVVITFCQSTNHLLSVLISNSSTVFPSAFFVTPRWHWRAAKPSPAWVWVFVYLQFVQSENRCTVSTLHVTGFLLLSLFNCLPTLDGGKLLSHSVSQGWCEVPRTHQQTPDHVMLLHASLLTCCMPCQLSVSGGNSCFGWESGRCEELLCCCLFFSLNVHSFSTWIFLGEIYWSFVILLLFVTDNVIKSNFLLNKPIRARQ